MGKMTGVWRGLGIDDAKGQKCIMLSLLRKLDRKGNTLANHGWDMCVGFKHNLGLYIPHALGHVSVFRRRWLRVSVFQLRLMDPDEDYALIPGSSQGLIRALRVL